MSARRVTAEEARQLADELFDIHGLPEVLRSLAGQLDAKDRELQECGALSLLPEGAVVLSKEEAEYSAECSDLLAEYSDALAVVEEQVDGFATALAQAERERDRYKEALIACAQAGWDSTRLEIARAALAGGDDAA